MVPLFDHLLTMPYRTGIDQQVLLDFMAEFIASEAR
jgi:hypothetical protein